MGNSNKPVLRFKGFDENWEKHKLGNLLKYEQPQKYIVQSTKYNNNNIIPVLTAGQSFILGYTDENFDIKSADKNNPVIIFDDFTTSSHYVDFPFKVKSSAMKLLTLADSKYDIFYLYNILKNLNFKPTTHERHWISLFSKFNVLLSQNIDEQQKISQFFANINNIISLHQNKYDNLKQIKESYLEAMFPKDGSDIPRIRFKGFDDKWEKHKLGNLCNITTGKLDANAMVPNGKYNFYTSGVDVYKIDTYAFEGPAITIAGNGYVGYMHLADGKFNAYQRTYVLTNFSADRQCLGLAIRNNLPQKIQKDVQGSCVSYIVLNTLTDLTIKLPSLEEQKKIGNFFAKLDERIELEQKEIQILKNIKQAFLNKMFVE